MRRPSWMPSWITPFCPISGMSTQVFLNLLWVPYTDQESKLGDIWLHTGPPSAPGLETWYDVRGRWDIHKDMTFKVIWDQTVRVKVRRWPHSPFGTIFIIYYYNYYNQNFQWPSVIYFYRIDIIRMGLLTVNICMSLYRAARLQDEYNLVDNLHL